jgi:hypothetical protein
MTNQIIDIGVRLYHGFDWMGYRRQMAPGGHGQALPHGGGVGAAREPPCLPSRDVWRG